MKDIIDMHARQILDSRGNPTIEVEVYTEEFIGTAAVPSGASTGIHEAVELRDGKKEFGGKGVQKAVDNVNTVIKNTLLGADISAQDAIDQTLISLDGTPQKKKLGANAMLGVSLAVSRAASAMHEMPLHAYISRITDVIPEDSADSEEVILPLLFSNVINGGVHAGNDLMLQEFMIVPTGAKTMTEAVQIVSEVYHELKNSIVKKYDKNAANVGDEGGFAPPVKNAKDALDILMKTVATLGLEKKISFAIDAAASEFYDKKKNVYEVEKGVFVSGSELMKYYLTLLKKYPIISLEDPFAEDDFDSWGQLMQKLDTLTKKDFAAGTRPQIVGDDLTVSNPKRIEIAIEKNLCDALLLKVNQIGTLSEALEAAGLALESGWNVMVSHRSGETEDPYIADLAVGLGCGQIKLGAPCRSDRTAKYNQLIRIAEELGEHGKLAKFE